MTDAIKNAKAVLAALQHSCRADGSIGRSTAMAACKSLSSLITYVESLEHQRDAVFKGAYVGDIPIKQALQRLRTPGLLIMEDERLALATFIERQAAVIAALTALPEDLEGLCERLKDVREGYTAPMDAGIALDEALKVLRGVLWCGTWRRLICQFASTERMMPSTNCEAYSSHSSPSTGRRRRGK